MNSESTEQIDRAIAEKKRKDHQKIKRLFKIAFFCFILRAILYFFGISDGLANLLWFPTIILLLASPFYGFEKLLEVVKRRRDR